MIARKNGEITKTFSKDPEDILDKLIEFITSQRFIDEDIEDLLYDEEDEDLINLNLIRSDV